MKSLTDIAHEQQRSRPHYYDDPEKDRMVALILELAEEVCVLRDAVDTRDRLAKAGVPATASAVDDFDVTPDITANRLQRHQAFFETTLQKLL